jgi:hypothetical protein
MTLPGLHHQIAMKRLAAGEIARQARRPECDPRTAYDKGVEAERLALESEKLCEHLHGNEQVMEGLLHQINYLAKSKHTSRHRSVAITYLETAYARLLMENGLPEPERKFEAVVETMPINGKKIEPQSRKGRKGTQS